MHGNVSTMRFSDNQRVTHHLPCSKGGQKAEIAAEMKKILKADLDMDPNVPKFSTCPAPRGGSRVMV